MLHRRGGATGERRRLVLRVVLVLPGHVERSVTAGAAQHAEPLPQRHPLPAIGADAVLAHAGEALRVLGAGHDRPAAWGLAHDLEARARHVHAFAHHVLDGLARSQLLHVISGSAAHRIVGVGPQSGPKPFGSHLPLLAVVTAPPHSAVWVGRWRGGRPRDPAGPGWSMRVAIITRSAGPVLC